MREQLPVGWTHVRVGDLARADEQPVLTGPFGTSMSRSDFVTEGLPVLTIGCLTESGIKLDKAVYVRPDKATELDRYRLRTGDLLFSRMASVGRAGIVPPALDGALFNYHIMRLRLSESLILPELFIAYVRGAPAVRRYLEDVNHGATRDGINTSQLVELPVSLPPLNEQYRIIAKLRELNARSRRAKEALEAVPPLLDQLRRSILTAAFRGDLTADWRDKNPHVEPGSRLLTKIRERRRAHWESVQPGTLRAKGEAPAGGRTEYVEPEDMLVGEALPSLPPSWCWTSAAEVVEPGADIVYGIVQPGPEVPDGVPYVRGLDIEGGRILESQLKRTHPDIAKRYGRAALSGGDILLGIIRATKVAIVPPTLEGANITQGTARFRPARGIDTAFLAGFLSTPEAQSRLHAMYRGIDMPGLNLRDVRRLPVPLAPIEEQIALARRLSECLERVDRMGHLFRSVLEKGQQLDAAILVKAFRGELAPQNPNDEPASVLLERVRAAREEAALSGTGSRRRSPKTEVAPATTDDRNNEDGDEPQQPVVRPAPPRQATKDITEVALETLQDEVFAALWTHGPLEKADAVRKVAEHLRQAGYVEFQRLRAEGPLYNQILKALETAVKAGRLDRPQRGHIRASKTDASDYTADDWRHALVASLGPNPTDRDEAIRAAAEWARDNLGLEFARLRSDGHIVQGLRSAINSSIRRDEVIRHNATQISRAAQGIPAAPGQLSLFSVPPAGINRRGASSHD